MSQKNVCIEKAKAFCLKHKERLTPPRIEVLKIIAASSKPIGAYQILEKLAEVLDSPKPPTAYRAIDFWLQKGFIHRIESLNAYVICHEDHRHNGGQFMICDDCGLVIEAHLCELPSRLKEKAKDKTFTPASWNVEIHGLCQKCQVHETALNKN